MTPEDETIEVFWLEVTDRLPASATRSGESNSVCQHVGVPDASVLLGPLAQAGNGETSNCVDDNSTTRSWASRHRVDRTVPSCRTKMTSMPWARAASRPASTSITIRAVAQASAVMHRDASTVTEATSFCNGAPV